MRLRTLPLSLSGVIVGIALASEKSETSLPTLAFLVLTAAFLQILSNLSNELGDTLSGTDTAERQGMHYSIQEGEMSVKEMKRLIAAVVVLCCLSGLAMIFFSFREDLLSFFTSAGCSTTCPKAFGNFLPMIQPTAFILLGIAAIWAAMHYTLGDNPYGYRGFGDIFVFIFFGLVSTVGAAFICCHSLDPLWALPASAFGCFSIGVLNVNNIRDMKTDAATRTTMALKMGAHNARIYQTVLISAAWCILAAYIIISGLTAFKCIIALTTPLFILHLKGVWTRDGRQLDPMLPMLVMSTFATSILFALAFTH